ncbi:hypothetical protein [Kitasatospora sp. NPDC098663]|uniref:hypothetical protein n=1 Tax=Kitasatospora sp. NPDC098663 TaxID=3364096 RepID=UPI00380D763D
MTEDIMIADRQWHEAVLQPPYGPPLRRGRAKDVVLAVCATAVIAASAAVLSDLPFTDQVWLALLALTVPAALPAFVLAAGSFVRRARRRRPAG